MTLDEAKKIANEVVQNKTRSHVESARDLALFVLSLETIRPKLPIDKDPPCPPDTPRPSSTEDLKTPT